MNPIPPEHCLLSEFFPRSPHATWWRNNLGWLVALLVAAIALLAEWAANRANMNVFAVYFSATTAPASGVTPAVSASFRNTTGYWGQLNWGFFQTLVLPLAAWLAFRFARKAGAALAELQKKGRVEIVSSTSPAETLMSEVARSNLRFRWLLLVAFVGFAIACFWFQRDAYRKAANIRLRTNSPLNWDFGQTQSPFVGDLTNVFNHSLPANQLTFLLMREREDDLAAALHVQLKATEQLTNQSLKTFLTRNRDGEVSGINLSNLVSSNVITLALYRIGGPDVKIRPQWWAFLTCVVLSQALTAFGWTLALWVIVKFGFWVWKIHRLIPGAWFPGNWRFKLLLVDPQRRFGLGPLFEPYNIIVFLAAIYGFYYALSLADATGTAAFTVGSSGGSQPSRIGNLIAIITLTLMVILGPIISFSLRVRRVREEKLDEIAASLGQTTKSDEQVALLKEEDLVSDQVTWPHEDKMCRTALIAVIAFLIIPLADSFGSLPSELSEWINFPRHVQKEVLHRVAARYKLPETQP